MPRLSNKEIARDCGKIVRSDPIDIFAEKKCKNVVAYAIKLFSSPAKNLSVFRC